MNEGEPKPKTQEEFHAELEEIENSIVELTRGLDSVRAEEAEERYMILAKKVENREIDPAKAILQAKEILNQLQSLAS